MPTKDGMVLIPGGTFTMGDNDAMKYEGPAHRVTLDPFWVDRYEVMIDEFMKFVKATAYRTTAERLKWSGVFDPKKREWTNTPGADWLHPDGPDQRARGKEPVVHMSFADVTAYAKWAKKRLPTEAEFEYAMRGGLERKRYPWGDELTPGGKYLSNCWQGTFPEGDEAKDGVSGRALVGSYPPNGYGLFDMAGNVWEWTSDWFADDYYKNSPRKNPKGPPLGKEKVLRGGSWLCSENYCTGYRTAARQRTALDSGLNNTGFRCARDATPEDLQKR